MDEKMYYKSRYDQSINNIVDIVVCIIIGIILAVIANKFFMGIATENSELPSKKDTILSGLMFIPIPYGLKRTWKSCLILRAGGPEAWFMWFFYIVIKLAIAFFYGLFAMPVVLIGSIISAVDYKGKYNKAESTYNMNNQYYMQNQQAGNVNGYDGRNYYG